MLDFRGCIIPIKICCPPKEISLRRSAAVSCKDLIAPIWDGLTKIQRADVFRYLVLWVHGGAESFEWRWGGGRYKVTWGTGFEFISGVVYYIAILNGLVIYG